MDIDAEKQGIQMHVDKGNYHAGINLAIPAMNECRRIQDQAGVDLFIGIIQGIANRIGEEFGS